VALPRFRRKVCGVTSKPACFSGTYSMLANTQWKWGTFMLWYAWVFLVIAIIAALFGFGGIAAGAVGIAKILFFIFLVLFVVSLLFGRRTVV
jgi:uncharacterized membrane protein YtjA (UPF0391 family)